MLLQLDFQSEVPIYKQIRDQIVLAIAQGTLLPGEKLPPIRTLAEDAGVNTMTVNKAYQLLKSEGYLVTDRRSGTTVCRPPDAGGPAGLDAGQTARLRLLAGEAKLAGLGLEEFLDLCKTLYCETEG